MRAFHPNDGSYAQPFHSIEECKRKRTDEESRVKTRRRKMVKKDIPWHYDFVGYAN